MTKEITLPSGRYLLTTVAKESWGYELSKEKDTIRYWANSINGTFTGYEILPEGHTYTLIGKADQLTEDQWCRIFPEVIYEKQHGLWWVKNNGFEIDTTLILKID